MSARHGGNAIARLWCKVVGHDDEYRCSNGTIHYSWSMWVCKRCGSWRDYSYVGCR